MIDNNTEFQLAALISKGGLMIYPLLLCSLAALAVIIQRVFWGPRESKVIPAELYNDVVHLTRTGRMEEILALCRSKASPLSRIIVSALKNIHRPRHEIVESIEVAGRKEAVEFQRYNGILATIAAVSPLLGLLGTVMGMIQTFSVIQNVGVGNANALAGGISEALITTAVGLTIAVPSLIFCRYFTHRARALGLALEEVSVDILDRLLDGKNSTGRAEERTLQAKIQA